MPNETTKSVIVNLPFFPGFYESILSGIMDFAVESEAYNLVEKESYAEYYPETYFPDELRLDHSDLWDSVSYGDAYREIAQDYCEAFDQWAQDNIATPANSFVFESMARPREYNFTTDRVFVTVPLAVMETLAKGVDVAKLQETIISRHKSRDGFISFYADDLETWQDKIADGIESLDHNELGTILCAAIAPYIDGDSDWQWQLCESVAENDYQYLDKHCDWQGYENKCQYERAEKLAKIICEDPGNAARLIASCERIAALESMALESDNMDSDCLAAWQDAQEARAYRCPNTIDMFSNGSAP